MTRELTGNSVASESNIVLPISSGGTESIKYESAAVKMQYPLNDNIGYPSGLTPLDPNGFIPGNMFPNIILNRTGVQVSGPLSVGIGITSTYTISNYVATTTYTVSALGGTASVSGSTVTYTAPLTVGLSGFVINGTSISINVIDPGKNPTVSGPSSLLENSQGTYIITNYDANSAYTVTAVQGSITRTGDTITYTAPGGDGINNINAGFSVNGSSTLVLITAPPTPAISGPTSIPYLTTTTFTITNYTAPATYNVSITSGNGTVSISGNTITYTSTSPNAIPITIKVNAATYTFSLTVPAISTPSILSPTNGASNLGPTLNFTSSVFSSTGSNADTHASTNWQLASDPAFTNIVQSSYNDITNLTTWTVNNLTVNTTYYVRVQYVDQFGNTSSYSTGVSFSTKAIYVASQAINTLSVGGTTSFGWSVAINGTGTVAVVGDYGASTAYIYTASGNVWTLAQTITQANSNFGASLAIDATGTNIVIGASGYNNGAGALFYYTKSGSTWASNGYLSDLSAWPALGVSVSISSDGSTVAAATNYGACVITSGSRWLSQVTVSGLVANEVAISGDGSTIVAGNASYNNYAGIAYVYKNISGTWTLTNTFNPVGSDFGTSVSINSTGTVIGITGYYISEYLNVFSYINSGWVNTISIPSFGSSVSISPGSTPAYTVVAAGNDFGIVRIYSYDSVNGAVLQVTITNGSNSHFGNCVALNNTGSIGIVGSGNGNTAEIIQ